MHLFKHFAHEMILKGHQVLFTYRERQFVGELLNHEGFTCKCIGKGYSSRLGKIWGLLRFTTLILLKSLKFKPDIFLSHGSMYAAFAAFLLSRHHIAFEDTFNFEQIRLYKPFTKYILTPDFEHPLNSRKVIRYAGYHELAYLHPHRFKPDITVLDELGVKAGDKYIIMRFVSWNASHDLGQKGMCNEDKIRAVITFEQFARVFISSEGPLPLELENRRIEIPPFRMHVAMAYSWLLFGESSTMAEEAAILGIPAIYISSKSTLYTKHLENDYGLLFNYSGSLTDQEMAIEKGVEVLKDTSIREVWKEKQRKLLNEKIDLTGFLIWFIENYPDSKRIMSENPDYQNNFL